jgi:fatty acid desaturase
MANAASPRKKDTSWREALSRGEIDDLLRLRDGRSAWTLAVNWGLVFGAMALVAAWPNPLTVVAALCVIGARQLGLAVLMHEAAHRSLFSNRRVNDLVGQWLCAYPVWADLHSYRGYHLRHHARTWTKDDPDLKLATPFPVSRASLWRKIARDLSGQTGLKFLRFSLRRDLGRELYESGQRTFWGTPRLRGVVASNAVLLAILAAAGHPLLYLLWVGAWFTTYTLVTRIRAIAEHSMSPDPGDSLRNTRTTLARWWERLLIAPNRVNYHLEHHLLITVPHYNLPRMHRLLRERGALDGALVARGYPGILRAASSRAA